MKINSSLILVFLILLINCNNYNILEGETMGTYYVIKIVDPFQHNYTPSIVQNKIDSLLEKINKHLSTYLEKSEINRFNESK